MIYMRLWRIVRPRFKPGTEYHYSNAELIEVVEEHDIAYVAQEVEASGLGWSSTEREPLFYRRRDARKAARRLGLDSDDVQTGTYTFEQVELKLMEAP